MSITTVSLFSYPFRKESNNISVQNVGEDVQDRLIPKPVMAFDEAFKNYRE